MIVKIRDNWDLFFVGAIGYAVMRFVELLVVGR